MVPDVIRDSIGSLDEVPGLEPLGEICSRQRISLTCHGGTPRRIAAAALAAEETERPWSIFDCVPFSADIDLVHSGPPAQTPAILKDIHDRVPFAEQLRWELRSREEQQAFDAAKTHAPIIPACLIQLDTNAGWVDPWGGLDDIVNGSLRLIRNHFYYDSPRFRAGDDVEILPVLLYYKAILEIPKIKPDPDGLRAAGQILSEAAEHVPTLTRLQESAYLRSRLRYLLASVKGLAGSALAPGSPLFYAWGLHRIGAILTGLGGESELRALLEWNPDAGHLAVSSRLGGDRYRLPPVARKAWTTGETLAASFARGAVDTDSERALALAGDQEVVLGSPALACAPGTSPSAAGDEFVHFCVRTEAPITAPSPDLAAICVITLDFEQTAVVSVPTVCTPLARDDGRLMAIRCNLGRALNTRDDRRGRDLQVFVSQWRGQEPRLSN